MLLELSLAAELRVSDGNQIMDEIDWSDVGTFDPTPKAGGIQSGMADIQIETMTSALADKTRPPNGAKHEITTKAGRLAKEREKLL